MQDQYTLRRPRRASIPFDALFEHIAVRTDIGSDAKLVYAKLTTMQRVRQNWSQIEIGERLGLSRHQVWQALGELSRAHLVHVERPGRGVPNRYTLLGTSQDDIAGNADSIRARQRKIRSARYTKLVAIYGEMCLRCGAVKDLEIDHVIPTALNGPDVFSNLQLLCVPCNGDKGATIADYRESPGVALASLPNPA